MVIVAFNAFALTSGEKSEALILESIYNIFSSKKSGLGTTQYHVCLFSLDAFPWTHRCRQDTFVWKTIFCNSLNAPPLLPKLSPSLGLIRSSEHHELRLSRS